MKSFLLCILVFYLVIFVGLETDTIIVGNLPKCDRELKHNGMPHENCEKVNTINNSGNCEGAFGLNNDHQIFCEQTQTTGLYGHEQKEHGPYDSRNAPGLMVNIPTGFKITMSDSFSINTECISERDLATGVNYLCE
ncbi:hypothetical protein QBC36DRAFT_290192 [Triangularia setosa]|uniref:Uncharacterized protein n=1 Tax=Triangularia setosa TaxID=2587417 RepID=A0AAN7A682_9PEZI|nr:hypothetical protein QBC36DRAFT_290192 [Podospora setosa]